MFFFLEDWQFVNEFRHIIGKVSTSPQRSCICVYVLLGISRLFPDSSGTTLVLIDDKSDAFVYNPVST